MAVKLTENGFLKIFWPGQSPDFNLNETILMRVKRKQSVEMFINEDMLY